MQCCVPNCASNELNTEKSENSGITYHEFPKDSQTRLQWLQDLHMGDWEPNAESAVCSLHFSHGTTEEMVETDNVLITFEELCRICLCTDRKVYNIGENDIAQQYELLTASKNCVGDVLPQYICWECKARLASFARLRSVALRSLEILHEFYETVKETTGDVQLIIDRDPNNLPSTLVRNNIQIVDYPPKNKMLVVLGKKPENNATSDLKKRNDNYKNVSVILSNDRKKTKVIRKNDNSELKGNLIKRSNIKVLSKGTKILKVINANVNAENRAKVTKASNKGNKRTIVKNANDNSKNKDDNSENRARLTKASNKGNKRTIVKNANDNSDDKNDNSKHRSKLTKTLNKGNKSTIVKNENDNFDDENDNFEDENDNFEDLDDTASEKSYDDYKSGLEDIIYDSENSESESDINNEVNSDLAKISEHFDYNMLAFIKRGINNDCKNIDNGENDGRGDLKIDKQMEETFSIKRITNEEQLNEFLQRKESDNYKNAGFKCDICYRGFVHDKAFLLHQLKHTDVNGPSKCPICSIHFRSPALVRNHIRHAHRYRYSCNHCDFVTGSITTAKSHVKFHNGTTYNCSQCDRTFQKPTSLLSHIRIHHPSDIVCRLCGYSFVNKLGLHLHERHKHKMDSLEVPEDGPRCVECDIQFSTYEALTTHYQESNKHRDLSRSRKREAPGVYTNRPKRKKLDKSVTCELCDTTLPNFVKYRCHFRESHPGQVRTQFPGNSICEICGLSFKCAAVLEDHKLSHSDLKQYSCEECGKQFKTKLSLKIHIKTHLNLKYSCYTCGNTFSSIGNLKRHEFVHKNLTFDCGVCGKSFNSPYTRQSHMDYIHLNKPWPVRNRGKKNKS